MWLKHNVQCHGPCVLSKNIHGLVRIRIRIYKLNCGNMLLSLLVNFNFQGRLVDIAWIWEKTLLFLGKLHLALLEIKDMTANREYTLEFTGENSMCSFSLKAELDVFHSQQISAFFNETTLDEPKDNRQSFANINIYLFWIQGNLVIFVMVILQASKWPRTLRRMCNGRAKKISFSTLFSYICSF